MLPGLRFLCAALVLSMSLLVFGFGATALLRSARLDAASLPALRAPPETVFAQPEPQPQLAMLRIEPRADQETPTTSVAPDFAQSDPALLAVPTLTESDRTAAPEKLAALPQPAAVEAPEPPQAMSEVVTETVKPDAPLVDVARLDVAPAVRPVIEAPPPAAETTPIATAPGTPPDSTEVAPVAAQPPLTERAPVPMAIAVLGGPAVTVTPVAAAKPVAVAPKPKAKETPRERTVKKKRVAARPAPAQQAPQPADPFAQPFR